MAGSLTGETPLDIPEEMKKAKRTSLTYSSLLLVLCAARLDDRVKLFGVDALVPSWFAILALVAAAVFYALGFYVEHRKFLNRGASSAADVSLRLDAAIDQATNSAVAIFNVERDASEKLSQMVDSFEKQFEWFWPQVWQHNNEIRTELLTSLEPQRRGPMDFKETEPLEHIRWRVIEAAAKKVSEMDITLPSAEPLKEQAAEIAIYVRTLPTASDRISAELSSIKEHLGTFTRNVRSFDKRWIVLHDVLPVYTLLFVALDGAVYRLARLYFSP